MDSYWADGVDLLRRVHEGFGAPADIHDEREVDPKSKQAPDEPDRLCAKR